MELSSPLKNIQSKVKEKISMTKIRKIVLEDLQKGNRNRNKTGLSTERSKIIEVSWK